MNETLKQLREDSVPIPGRPGYRRDYNGREWYSECFLGAPELDLGLDLLRSMPAERRVLVEPGDTVTSWAERRGVR